MLGSNRSSWAPRELEILSCKELARVVTMTGQGEEPVYAWLILQGRGDISLEELEVFAASGRHESVKAEALEMLLGVSRLLAEAV